MANVIPSVPARLIKEIALEDPIRAYAVAQCGQAQQTVSGSITLTAADLGNPRSVQLDQIPAFSWLDDFTYDVDAPLFAPGNIARWDALDKMARRPGVQARAAISQGFGPRNHLVGLDYQPLQQLLRNPNIPGGGCCDWIRGIFLDAYQALQLQVLLSRTLGAGEDPLVLTFTMKISTVGFNPYVQSARWAYTNEAAAIAGLGALGVLTQAEQSSLAGLRAHTSELALRVAEGS